MSIFRASEYHAADIIKIISIFRAYSTYRNAKQGITLVEVDVEVENSALTQMHSIERSGNITGLMS